MSIRRCILCVLCAFVLSSALFSTSASAQEVATSSSIRLLNDYGISTLQLDNDSDTNGEVRVAYSTGSANTWANWYTTNSLFIPPYNDLKRFTLGNNTIKNAGSNMYDRITFAMEDGTRLLKKNQGATITLGNIVTYIEYYGQHFTLEQNWDGIAYFDTAKITRSEITYISTDGSQVKDYSPTVSYINNGDKYTVTLEVDPQDFEIKEIRLLFVYDIHNAYGLASDHFEDQYYANGTLLKYTNNTRNMGFQNGTLNINVSDESVGLISGIIEWVKGIYNSIVELPQKLAATLTDGIKSLFVPSEEVMVGIKEDWDELLSSRFGAVYEAGTIMIEFASGLTETVEQEYIEFPKVSYSFSGVPFEFGGWNVDIVPDQFNWLAEVLKGVLDIVCTLAFLNTLRKKYDEMVG